MKTKQLFAPFDYYNFDTKEISLADIKNNKIIQIGIEIPQNVPLIAGYNFKNKRYTTRDPALSLTMQLSNGIDTYKFSVAESEILEFDGLYLTPPLSDNSLISIPTLKILNSEKVSPYLIINIGYE